MCLRNQNGRWLVIAFEGGKVGALLYRSRVVSQLKPWAAPV